MTGPSITIGWFPRERFAVAAESLRSLLDNSPDCRLIIVDPNTPSRYMREIEATLGDHPAEFIRTGEYVLPSTSRNLVLERVDTEYVALVENDVLFTPGWVEKLVAACEEVPADMASPILYEGRGQKEHFDKGLGQIRESREQPGKYEVVPLTAPRNSARTRQVVDFVEQHCLVCRMTVFDKIGGFNPLFTRDDVDLGFALWNAKCTAVLEPSVQAHFVSPSWRPAEDELPFYRFRWDLQRAQQSRDEIRERWNLVDTPGDLGFVKYRTLIAELPRVRQDLSALATETPGSTILLDNGDWLGTDVVGDVGMIPFPNLDGRFGGFPASDTAAIAELEQAIANGATRIVIGFPAFWWSDYLPDFTAHLQRVGRLHRNDDLLRVFDFARS